MLDSGDLCWGQFGGGVWCKRELHLDTVVGHVPRTWAVFWHVGLRMLELAQGGFDAAWHGDVDTVVVMVPLHGEIAAQLGFPVGGERTSMGLRRRRWRANELTFGKW